MLDAGAELRGWTVTPPARPLHLPSLEFPETREVWLFRRVISSRLQLLGEWFVCVCVGGSGVCVEKERETGRE